MTAQITDIGPGSWRNYHRTVARHVADHRRLVIAPAAGVATPAVVAASARCLMALLAEVGARGGSILPVGGGWSFSDILADDGMLLETRAATSIDHVTAAQRADAGAAPLVLATAGTPIGQLNRWLEARSLSLFTSGAHDGQTIAGAMATGVHGSAVGFGPFQNHVRGIHLVTAPGGSIWLERGPAPVLAPGFVATFASEARRDADQFDAALVHLGGLGIVNAVLLEVSPGFSVDVVKRKGVLTRALVRDLAAGRFEAFARHFWPQTTTAPYYVEVTVNPFAPFDEDSLIDRPALVTLFFSQPALDPVQLDYGAADDVLNCLARVPLEELFPLPQLVPEALSLTFATQPAPGAAPARRSWGQANGAHKWPSLGGVGIAFDLYNAAYAVERARLAEALDVMLAGFAENGGGHLVFTLRFVAQSQGLMAFTRFAETAVVNFDGLRTARSEGAARNVALALEREGVPFSQHWGKQGLITANRVARDFGSPADPASRTARWQAARQALVPAAMQPVFGNDALRRWGLI
jgi:hypothetical protein